SRLSRQKGLDHLIEIFRRLRERRPRLRLLIAGDGPERRRLEERVSQLGLASSIELLGYVPHRDLADHYSRASVFVSTSAYEPFGLPTLEAMASGCPVVVSPLGGAPDFVRDELDGYLRLPQRAQDFADAAGRILSDDLLRRRMSDSARLR